MARQVGFEHSPTSAVGVFEVEPVTPTHKVEPEGEDVESGDASSSHPHKLTEEEICLNRTGKFAGGLVRDCKRRYPFYLSDLKDAATVKTISSSLFMYFACLTPAIAFGTEVNRKTNGEMGIIEFLMSQAVTGIVFALVSGQPLVILRPTGPITLYITQLYAVCQALHIDFLKTMSWVGIFIGVLMIIVSVSDLCALIRHITRYTQDIFGFFIALIFIYTGFENMVGYFRDRDGAGVVYEEAFFDLIMSISCFYLAFKLSRINLTYLLNDKARQLISDFAVPLAIAIVTGVSFAPCSAANPDVVSNLSAFDVSSVTVGRGQIIGNLNCSFAVDRLPLPTDIGPTCCSATQEVGGVNETVRAPRPWVTPLFDVEPWVPFIGLAGSLPLIFLFFIDQNVTSLLTQHQENNLKKPSAYHLNFFIIGVFNIVMPLFGCPFVTGSLPHSPQFVRSLAEVDHHGKVTKVHENRIAPLITNVLIAASIFLVSVLRYLPVATLDGLFFFMGVGGLLGGNQLFDRIVMMLSEKKSHEPTFYRKHVPLSRVHLFTLTQLICMAVLWIVRFTPIALAFPFFIIALVPIRKYLHLIMCNKRVFQLWHLRVLDGEELDEKEMKLKSRKSVAELKGQLRALESEEKAAVREASAHIHEYDEIAKKMGAEISAGEESEGERELREVDESVEVGVGSDRADRDSINTVDVVLSRRSIER